MTDFYDPPPVRWPLQEELEEPPSIHDYLTSGEVSMLLNMSRARAISWLINRQAKEELGITLQQANAWGLIERRGFH